jgi:signal transduction histidine kinase
MTGELVATDHPPRRSRTARLRQDRLRRGAMAGGALLVVVGVTVMLGWWLDVAVMQRFGLGSISMKIHTAAAFIEVGALVLLAGARPGSRVGAWLAAPVAVVPVLTLVEYLTGANLGIDNVFGADHTDLADYPGRMAPMTAVGLLGLAIGLAATFLRRPIIAQVAALFAVLTSLVALIGYGFGVESLYRVQEYVSIAVTTAVGLGIGGVTVLALNTSAGILSVVVGTTAGGVVSRALLPPIVAVQVLVSGLVLVGVVHGTYSFRFGFALVAVGDIVGGVTLVLLLTYVLRTSDLRRAGAEAALERAHEASAELVAANAVLEDFAAMAAHDLRTPLAAVLGYAELLQDGLAAAEAGPDDLLDLARRIQQAARRGDEMITDLLAFARLGARSPEPDDVDLAVLVTEVALEVAELHQRPLRVEMGDLPVVFADRSLLNLLVVNVLTNAVKYVPSDRPAVVVVDAVLEQHDEVVVRFADNGEGIAEDDRGRLMRMFERGSSGSEVSGTGIGLAICARVAEAHGGRFWIEDAPSGGARFCVSLPRRA